MPFGLLDGKDYVKYLASQFADNERTFGMFFQGRAVRTKFELSIIPSKLGT